MIHIDQILAPQQCQRPRHDRNALQRRPHAGPPCVADAADVVDADACLPHRLLHQPDDPCSVMLGGDLGQKSFAGWRVVGVAEVAEDDGRGGRSFIGTGGRVEVGWWEFDDAYAELVGAAFEADGYHCGSIDAV